MKVYCIKKLNVVNWTEENFSEIFKGTNKNSDKRFHVDWPCPSELLTLMTVEARTNGLLDVNINIKMKFTRTSLWYYNDGGYD